MTILEEVDALLGGRLSQADLRIAIMGIGNELNGDDGAGVLAARALIERIQEPEIAPPKVAAPVAASEGRSREMAQVGGVMVIAAGPAPESFTGPLRRFSPHAVLLLDAAEMGSAPGEIQVFDWQEAGGMSASTHTLPPSTLARFLASEIGCRVLLVGIQPGGLAFDTDLSAPARQAVDQLVYQLAPLLAR